MSAAGLVKRHVLRASAQQRPSRVVLPLPAVPAAAVSSASRPVQAEATQPMLTPAQLHELKEAARAEGLALGRQQARQEAQAAIRDQLAALESLIASVSQAWREERARMQDALADFAFVSTNRLLGDCLRDPSMAMEAVRSALGACGAWQGLTLELHPHDAQRLGNTLEAEAALKEKSLRVVASTEVRVGGCRITSAAGVLDARLEFQLAQLRARLDAECPHGAGDGGVAP